MDTPSDSSFDPRSFSGQVRLFPVPNLVMFPHVLQPLHVFEPRYRAMMKDALDGDQLIAMAVLRPGWEADYEDRPRLYPMACLGQIVNSQQLEDGRYHLLLQGLGRIALGDELAQAQPFRIASAELQTDDCDPDGANRRRTLKREILDAAGDTVSEVSSRHVRIEEMLGEEMALGVLTDILAYSLSLPLELKAEMLGELNVDLRAAMLLSHLKAEPGSAMHDDNSFPPGFSPN